MVIGQWPVGAAVDTQGLMPNARSRHTICTTAIVRVSQTGGAVCHRIAQLVKGTCNLNVICRQQQGQASGQSFFGMTRCGRLFSRLTG